MIFKAVRDCKPYPDHKLSTRDWANVAPRPVRLNELTTTKRELALDKLLDEDSTFYGDLFPHAVQWEGELYLEDGLHRAVRAALQQRHTLHVRVLDLDELRPASKPDPPGRRPVRPSDASSRSRTTASASSRPRWVSTSRPRASGSRSASPQLRHCSACRVAAGGRPVRSRPSTIRTSSISRSVSRSRSSSVSRPAAGLRPASSAAV